ncbi:MAG TPA: efflux RND transporter permease subunit, partial [Holophaga sp.]|nr:efflux RND transporter permease subunit [Holophaga sp.]
SQQVALAVRERLRPMFAAAGATFSVAEIPSGPPTLAPLVAEVYAPDDAGRVALAASVKQRLEAMPGVVDVDWSGRPGPKVARFVVSPQLAALRGVAAAQAATTTRLLFDGDRSTWAQFPREYEPVEVAISQPRSRRAGMDDLAATTFTPMTGGAPVSARDIGRVEVLDGTAPLMRMDLQPVILVTAAVTGEGPLYTAIDLSRQLRRGAETVQVRFSGAAPDPQDRTVKWSGDWSTQRDLLRDLGGASLVVLLLIYGMLVAWYESFLLPFVIMLPIPLILVGVIPAHPLLGKAIDATGLIGTIALAGIMVRNSILLVDFASGKIRAGFTIREAVVRGSRTRLRPICLTALAVILGEMVLLHDSLLQSLGIALV